MPSPKPAVIIRREFEATPEIITQQLRACIIGPAYQLVRFADATEKANGFVNQFNSLIGETFGSAANAAISSAKDLLLADTLYSIPSISEGSLIDADSVKLFMEDALLTYADFVDEADSGKDFRPSTNAQIANSLVLDSGAWRGSNRNSRIPQDVEVGDVVQLYTTNSTQATLAHTTKVAGFVADSAPGGIGTPTVNFSNANTAGLSTTTLDVSGARFTLNAATAFNSEAKLAFDPRRTGSTVATYRITINSYGVSGGGIGFGEPGAEGGTLNITVAQINRGPTETITTNLVADGTASVTTPSGIVITAVVLGTVSNKANAQFTYNIGHTPYAYAASVGALKVTAGGSVADIPTSTVYNIRCITGGSVRTAAGAAFEVTTNNSVDSPTQFVVRNLTTGGGQLQAIGSYGLTLNFGPLAQDTFAAGFVTNNVITIPVTAATSSNISTLNVADPYIATAPIARVRLSKRKTVEINKFKFIASEKNWEIANPQNSSLLRLNLSKNIVVRDSSIGSGDLNVNVTAGKLYIQYRSVLNLPRAVGSVRTLSDITSQLGVIDPDNHLAYAVYKAWTNANGATVHFIPTISPSLNGFRGFADALDLAKGNRNCYSLVPLSTSSEVWNAFVGHIQDESAPDAGRYRIVWVAPEVEAHYKVQDSPVGSPNTILTGTTSVVDVASGQYLLSVGAGQDARFTETVRVGDWVRTGFESDVVTGQELFKEYKVVGVVDNLTLVIEAAENPNLQSRRLEIYRDLTSAETASILVQIAGGFSSERVFAVVPNRGVNGFRVSGKPVRNWNIAAAFAGLRSGSRPHQPLSNVELLGFDGNNPTPPAFNETDLDTLRDGGVWVVVNSDEGKIYAERQLSTSTLDNFRKEQSVTCNIDSMSFSIGDGLKNLVGRVNITNNNLNVVRANLDAILFSFTSSLGSETIGPQLNSYTIEEIFVPTTANDTVKAKVVVSVPLPMNIIDITIVV